MLVFFQLGPWCWEQKLYFLYLWKKSDENSLSQPNQDILAMNYEW